jgi:peptidoglycan/xylan/chitin deacetylase (PgdA/CDA1 family)
MASVLAVGLFLFGLGICMVRLGYFVRSFCRDCRPGAGVALTFDDGPDPSGTGTLLESLSVHGVKAAFFPVGRRAEAHPELVRAIHEDGHIIGNHSYGHGWFTNLLIGKSLEKEIARAQGAIEAAVGKIPRFFRPPAGLTNPHYRKVLKRLGLHLIGWNVRVFDTRKKADKVVDQVLKKVRNGSIILIHEGCREPGDLRGMVDSIITGIRARGFTFTDLEEMTGLPAYQEVRESSIPLKPSLLGAWRASAEGRKKGRIFRFAGIWLSSTTTGRNAILAKADLTAFKKRPSIRFLAGMGLILVAYIFGWPMIGLFGFLAAYFHQPGLLMIGILSYGLSHFIFLPGVYLAGRDSLKYAEVFFLWSLRKFVEWLTGNGSAGSVGC